MPTVGRAISSASCPSPGRRRRGAWRLPGGAAFRGPRRSRRCAKPSSPPTCRRSRSSTKCSPDGALHGTQLAGHCLLDMNAPGLKLSTIKEGLPYPKGATWDGKGVNFALFSAHATKVELYLFESGGKTQTARIELPEYRDEFWHGYVPEIGP